MTGADPVPVGVLERAVRRAALAPSVHNSQPWRFELGPGRIRLWADRTRQLGVVDPAGRQLVISCGCALFNVRVALAADGYEAHVDLLPDPGRPDLLARITATPRWGVRGAVLAALDPAVDERRTNRRRFVAEPVPDELVAVLVRSASSEGARLTVLRTPAEHRQIAELGRYAAAVEEADPDYGAELRAWTTDDPRRPDGVQAMSIPFTGPPRRGDGEWTARDFDAHRAGWLPQPRDEEIPLLFVLGTEDDRPRSWIAAGQALERVLLETTRAGFVAALSTQPVEVPAARDGLRRRLSPPLWPHVVLRVGHAPDVPASPRRPVRDTVVRRRPASSE